MTGSPSSSNTAAITATTTGPTLSERERVVELRAVRAGPTEATHVMAAQS
ncbi:MAG TPA: hypothetical protein VN650_05645 [Gemmatimonadaceae bacterium]|nr:hypothetical protein [Gemmatimonadaceae bacterium]